MALQGNIESFPVADVLRLLASQLQTGRLRVHGERGPAAVYMDRGRLVAAERDGEPGVSVLEAVVRMVRTAEGTFAFDTSLKPLQSETPAEVEAALNEADYCVAEWEEVESVIADLHQWVAPASELDSETVTLNADQWRVLVSMGNGSRIVDIVAATSMPRLEVAREVKALMEVAVVELGEAPQRNGSGTVAAKTESGSILPPPPDPIDSESSEPASGGARVALTSLASSLDRRLADVGPPPGVDERRVNPGSILDATDIAGARVIESSVASDSDAAKN